MSATDTFRKEVSSMDNVIIKNILTEMADYLNVSQMRKLQDVILDVV